MSTFSPVNAPGFVVTQGTGSPRDDRNASGDHEDWAQAYDTHDQSTPSLAQGPGPSVQLQGTLPTLDCMPVCVVVQAFHTYNHPDVPTPMTTAELQSLGSTLREFVDNHGDFLRVRFNGHQPKTPTVTALVEFDNQVSAANAIQHTGALTGRSLVCRGAHIICLPALPISHLLLALHRPDLAIQYLPIGTSVGDMHSGLYYRAAVRRMWPCGLGRCIVDMQSLADVSQLPPERQQDFVLTFQPDFNVAVSLASPAMANTNAIVRAKIIGGQEVRTTVMIRNIPNSITQDDILNLLNTCVPGLFDFLYLRIDFANGCNVGYGFVNFISAEAILVLLDMIAFKKWHSSNKMVECCWATWQGLEALVAKFRNSAVMQQDLSARPRIFCSINDGEDSSGMEKEFPGPDNMAKLQQSLASAGQIGLYPSRNANTVLTPPRRRRGDFDRGNTYDLQQQTPGSLSYGGSSTFAGSSTAYTPTRASKFGGY